MKKTRNFADVIRAKLAADPGLASRVESESFNSDIAQKVYELRTAQKLTQKELASRVGTAQSVISRIEDADYDGHSLGLLKRIADALDKNLRVDFCDRHPPNGAVVSEFKVEWSPAAWDERPFREVYEAAFKESLAAFWGAAESSATKCLPSLVRSDLVPLRK